jgi:hypothetical protein
LSGGWLSKLTGILDWLAMFASLLASVFVSSGLSPEEGKSPRNPARICKFNSTKRLATCHQTEKEKRP